MTGAIAERCVKLLRLADSVPVAEIAKLRALRYAFLDGTTTFDDVSALAAELFEPTFIDDYDTAYELLKSGKIDAFIEEGTSEAAFDVYGDVVSENFFPMIYSPVSLTTKNPELAPVILVVQKALQHGGLRHLTEMYTRGQTVLTTPLPLWKTVRSIW